ncbi:MAG: hypothetical protein HY443_01395 [Candidatus Nealsonbacteria bacterium]|nr:hypothetical protein [Candidatus Nealsonbacteria bacterium]
MELLIYIAIVGGILALSLSFVWQIIQGEIKARVFQEVQDNADFAMRKIVFSLRSGQSPSIFTVSDGILYRNGVALTASRVRVSNLQFVPVSGAYKINLEIEYRNPSARPEYSAAVTLENTVVPRY